MRLKLSNSGEALNLWLPRNGTKAICIWINNPSAVTTSKIMETEIGNRGSKSIIGMSIHTLVIIVNEQRVDGSWWEKSKNKCISHLRCTLLGFERNFKVSYYSVGGPKSRKALRDGEPRGLIPIPLLRYGTETEKIQTYISYSTNIRVPWAKKSCSALFTPSSLQWKLLLLKGKIFIGGRRGRIIILIHDSSMVL